MALSSQPTVGTRPEGGQFRNSGLAPYEGYISESAFKGDSKQLQVIQGLNTALTDQNAMLQALVDESKKQSTALQRQLRYSAEGTAAGTYQAVPSTVFDPSQQAANPLIGPPGSADREIAKSRARTAAYSGAGPSSGEGPSTRDILGQEGGGEPLSNPLASNLTRAGQMEQPDTIRGKVAQAIQGRLSRAEWGESLEFNEGAMRWRNPMTNRFVSDAAGQGFMRRQAVMRGAQNFMGSIAEGETVAGAAQGALGAAGFGTAAKVLGGAGAVLTAAQVANNIAMGQQAANREVQGVTGGGTMEAFGERGRQKAFTLSQSFFGGIGGQAAEELYRGARDIYGTDRPAREAAEEFGVEMHKLGMDISESLELVKIAAKTGNESLRGLSDGIKGVSEAARRSGISGAVAREQFTAAYAGQTQTTGGETAVNLAEYETEAMIGMGRNLTDVTLGQAASEGSLRQQAAMAGMTYNDFLARRQQSTVFAAQAEEAFIQERNPVAQNQRARTLVKQRVDEIQRENGGKQLSDSDWESISREVQQMGIVDAGALANILNSTVTTGLTERTAYEFATRALISTRTEDGETVAAGVNLGGMAEEHAAKFEAKPRVSRQTRDFFESQANVGGALGAFKSNKGYSQYAEIIKAIGGDPEVGSAGQSGDRKNYLRRVMEDGEPRDPVIEAMLNRGDLSGDTRYLVQTDDGDKEVTFSELMSDYSDQARSAEVIRGGGGTSGQKVHEIFQIEEGEQGKSVTEKAKSGWERGRNKDTIYSEGGGKDGKVTIELTDEARKLINIRTSGSAVDSRTGGANPPVAAEARP